ncbi:MAG: hypothetical protein A3K19_31740 [Lentisphaerae bacterium RIFOXYB12_FULL_65_16]|nr:MAG: hypothetical protein A3K18_10520 [Lentisphaerae bacterium RIFOXYA12_64_32]OGV88676.1 MAG: hypothetical protein A3K19_31740 [Lentisphaerae bacterium RIFOXYB12_FULL_65_16]
MQLCASLRPWTCGILLPFAVCAAQAAEFCVAPAGNDANAGTREQPFATLERARDAVRELKKAGPPAGGVTVWLRSGVYRLDQSFALGAEDSGTKDAPVVYRGCDGEEARLMGGAVVPVAAFAPVSDPKVLERLDPAARGQVLQADLNANGITDRGDAIASGKRLELFFEQKRMTLARWPNSDYTHVGDVVGGAPHRIHGIPGDKIGRFTYDGDRQSRWVDESDVRLHGYWFWDWADGFERVQAIDPVRKVIETVPPYHGYGYRKNARYYALNVLAELDTPGEWYVDRQAGMLYFWPPTPIAGKEVALSMIQTPLVALDDVSYVTFRNLTLEFSRHGALTIKDGTGNRLAGCVVRNVAATAIAITDGTDHGVLSCDIYDVGAAAINLSGGDRKSLTPCGHFATNNHIHHFSRLYHTYRHAINLQGVGCSATHNYMHDCPHEPMGFSGNDHVIEFNEFGDVCLSTDDSGAIHTGRDWTWQGTVIRYNFFHHIGGGPHVGNQGVYLDDMMSGTTVYGNVFYQIYRANLVGGGRDNILENNIIVDCKIPIHIDNRLMNWAGYHKDTTMKDRLLAMPYKDPTWSARYPKLVGIWEDDPAVPKGNIVRRNLMVRCGEMSLAPEVKQFGTFADNLSLDQDPGFANCDTMDFALADDAPVYRQIPGFEKVPFDKIGLYVDEYRKVLPVRNPLILPNAAAFVGETQVRVLVPGRTAGAEVRYTLDGTEPTRASTLYAGPLQLTQTTTLSVAVYPPGTGEAGRSGTVSAIFTAMHLGPDAGIYLSDLEATDVFCYGALRKDSNFNVNGPMNLGGVTQAKGVVLCPQVTPEGGRGRATYTLDGGLRNATRFKATVGIEDSMAKRGSATFAVEVFRAGKWEPVFDSGIVRGGDAPKLIDVDITGAEKLRLLTTDAGDNIHCDHAAWGNATLQ